MKDQRAIGKTGPDSIRFGGRTVDELPIAESAYAKKGLIDFAKHDHEQKINRVRERYPETPTPSVDGFLRECKANLRRTRDFIADMEKRKGEYKATISMCKHRDGMIAKLNPDTDMDEIKRLYRETPDYSISAMEQQIKQFDEAIDRGHNVASQEISSIAELEKLRVICSQRDQELEALGVAV